MCNYYFALSNYAKSLCLPRLSWGQMRQNRHGFVTKWLYLEGSDCDPLEITATKWRLSHSRGAAQRRSRGGAESAVSRTRGEGAGGRVRQGAASQPNQGRAGQGSKSAEPRQGGKSNDSGEQGQGGKSNDSADRGARGKIGGLWLFGRNGRAQREGRRQH